MTVDKIYLLFLQNPKQNLLKYNKISLLINYGKILVEISVSFGYCKLTNNFHV